MKAKRAICTLLGAAMLAVPVLTMAGCDEGAQTFAYDDGISQTGNYDSSVFFRNDLDVDWFADPGALPLRRTAIPIPSASPAARRRWLSP